MQNASSVAGRFRNAVYHPRQPRIFSTHTRRAVWLGAVGGGAQVQQQALMRKIAWLSIDRIIFRAAARQALVAQRAEHVNQASLIGEGFAAFMGA